MAPLKTLLRHPGACVFVVALLARLAGQAFLNAYLEPRTWEYEVIANNLLSGQGYTYEIDGTTYIASQSSPLYVCLVAGVYLVTGHSQAALLVIQALLGAATASLAAWLAARTCTEAAAWWAGLLVALDPGLLIYAAELHSLTLDALAFVVLVCGVVALRRSPAGVERELSVDGSAVHAPGVPRLVLLGALFGLATLTRSTALILLPLVLAWLVHYRGLRLLSRHSAALVGVALLVCAPWSVRNSALLGQPVLVSSEATEWLWRGNNPAATGSSYTADGRRMLDAAPAEFQDAVYTANESQRVSLYRDAALRFVRDQPVRAAVLYLSKLKAFWWSSDTTGLLYPPEWLSGYYVWSATILLLAALGCVYGLRSPTWRPEALLILLVLLLSALTQSLFYVEGRHRLAVEPLLLVLSGVGLQVTASLTLPHAPFRRPGRTRVRAEP
jgi:4-amino-4-deoxy-L-arabinose transferase-like glycosyltransferase